MAMTASGSETPSTTASSPEKHMSPPQKEKGYFSNDVQERHHYPHAQREPFFAFIPKLAAYGCGLVAGELGHVKNAVTAFPSWSVSYGMETFSFYRENPGILYKEVISGFTVAIMQVPESIAFSFVAGVPPLSGLQATFWMAVITGLFGGKPGMISGAAGALAVVVADLTADDGDLDYLSKEERLNVLYMTMVVCGAMQIAFAWLRAAKLVRLIPETGMIGFMNGLAIIIFLAQLPAFQKCGVPAAVFVDCDVDDREWLTFTDDTGVLILSLVHVAICMGIMKYWSIVPKIGKMVPASLVALLFGTLIEHTLFRDVFDIDTRTVKETAAMSGDLPRFDWPKIPNDSETINTVLFYAVTLAAIGGVESVLTLQACNEITDTVPQVSDSNQELFAQGLANLVSGMFRAMGGDAMIGQSTINIMNGARYRVSSTTSGLFMLLFIVALSDFIELIPVSTLTGVLFMVVLSTFQWKTFVILRYGRLSDSGSIVLVTLIAVFFNLAVAIAIGIVFSALVHAWDSGAHVEADVAHKRMIVNKEECDVKYVHIRGTLFFSSVRHFISLFSVTADPDTVIIDFKDALVIDHSAVAAIQGVTHRFAQVGKRVLLTNLPHKSHGRLHRTGDHEQLKEQITPASQIQHVAGAQSSAAYSSENGVAGGGKGVTSNENGGDTDSRPTATTSQQQQHGEHEGFEVVDESHIGEALGKLNMLQCPVDPVDDELEGLQQQQGEYSIHSKKDT